MSLQRGMPGRNSPLTLQMQHRGELMTDNYSGPRAHFCHRRDYFKGQTWVSRKTRRRWAPWRRRASNQSHLELVVKFTFRSNLLPMVGGHSSCLKPLVKSFKFPRWSTRTDRQVKLQQMWPFWLNESQRKLRQLIVFKFSFSKLRNDTQFIEIWRFLTWAGNKLCLRVRRFENFFLLCLEWHNQEF